MIKYVVQERTLTAIGLLNKGDVVEWMNDPPEKTYLFYVNKECRENRNNALALSLSRLRNMASAAKLLAKRK
jgi:hypothetical protein